MTIPLEDGENTKALKRALFALKDMRAKLDAIERTRTEPIAIIGLGCRFPGEANTPEKYWEILNEGKDAIREVPSSRWDVESYYDPDPDVPGKMYVRKSGFIDQVDQFEPQFFGISPREAVSMDPQQRLLLEVTWETLEYAGIIPGELAGSQTGVFIGMSTNDYSGMLMKVDGLSHIDAYIGTGTSFSVAAGRISYFLGLHGPTLTLDTACSSSLVAIHLACQSLRAGQSNLALAGGVSLILAPEGTVSMSKSHALAPDGHSKTFDASADGYARGEGAGMVVLKRLSDALADGDNILALIKGSAINHDGRSSGLTVPNGTSQQAVIRAALKDAGGIEPQQIQFVETHGTGTQLGDPIEVRALAGALGKGRAEDKPLVLGSVKANIGHLEAAAGMAGLIKTVLAFQNEKIPAQLHFKEPNPNIDWQSLPVKVAGKEEIWRRSDIPRVAGVNSFGFSGTNAHIVLEEAPLSTTPPPPQAEHPKHLLTLSANNENALTELASRYSSYFETYPIASLNHVTYTANNRRTLFTHRLAVVGDSTGDFLEKLKSYVDHQESSGVISGLVQTPSNPKIAFLFTGQGSQYIDMGKQLYQTQPVFRSALEECDELLRPYLKEPLLSVLYPKPGEDSPINETAYTQPALFAIEYALTRLWRSWGVTPSAVMGHSVGEYVAACVAGVFSLEDGLKLIAERGRLMQSLPRDGAMVAIFADADQVAKAVAPYSNDVSIAAFNGPENVVISGRDTAVQAVLDRFTKDGIKVSRLTVSHAFHSPLMEPILDSFEQTAASLAYSKPDIALVSNVTGGLVADEQTGQRHYWRAHIRRPVQFQKAMETLHEQGYEVFLEVGPQPALLGMGQRCIPGGKNIWLASLRQRKDDWLQMLESLGTLYVQGIKIDWDGFHQNDPHQRIPLPTYPFQRQRYWFKAGRKSSHPDRPVIHPLLGNKVRSPMLSGTVFETQLSIDFPTFLNDHRIYETAIFPGSGYVEMALAAAQQIFGGQNWSLADMIIREALVLPDEVGKTIQITISALEAESASFEVFSLHEDGNSSDEWKLHASGTIHAEPTAAEKVIPVDVEKLKTASPKQVTPSAFYEQLADLGIEYGPAFRGLSQIWQGDNEALGQIILPPEHAAESHSYQLHPALLDACFQLLGASTPPAMREESDKVYVPVGLQSLKVYRTGQSQIWAHVSFSSPVTDDDGAWKDSLTGDIKLFSQDGVLVAEVVGLQIRRISRDAIRQISQRNIDDWLYELNWEVSSSNLAIDGSMKIDLWLIFADQNGVGDRLAEQLKVQGVKVVMVKTGDEYKQMDESNWMLNPTNAEHFDQLLSELSESLNSARSGILHLWSLDNPFDAATHRTDALLRDAQNLACGSILRLVQAMSKRSILPARLYLITQGVHVIKQNDDLQGIAQASVWGLGRTIALEYPNWKCACVDITPDVDDTLFDEVVLQDDENQIALRGRERYVARLERSQEKTKGLVVPADEPFELVIPAPGVLEHLELKSANRRSPGAGEVEIRVRATGLNFRDVLNALGMYPGAHIPLGIECAGVVVAVGKDVMDFKIGDEVIGLATGSFRSFATIPLERVFSKPVNTSLVQATSIPTTFLTAMYGLRHLANIKAGDRVLIHAAAGGVGLAAVQLAKRAGAVIFGTAGSPEKRAYLKSLGVEHVFDSRNFSFAEEIKQITDGAGVNIVLNSLADEFIPKSLSVLADHGCFLEMGKRDDWDQDKVSQLNPTLKYHRYDLGTEMVNDMPFIRMMLNEILSDFEKEVFQPLPLRTFPMESAREAFRYMAQAKHIGKIVITQEEESPLIREDGVYLITGGLGGLGLETAAWLVEHGAKHLVLLSRSQPDDTVNEKLTKLRAGGCEISIVQGDVSHREDLERMLDYIEHNMPPLRGLFHEAGVLDDGVLSQQNWQRFERVLAPKVDGAWHLHVLTQGMSLDFFVLFSTAAAVLGSAGQANYTAANSFLDGLAHYRTSRGLPATSINWGAWGEVGMAASVGSRNPNHRTSRDVDPINPDEGLKVLERLLTRQLVQAIVLPTKWNNFDGKPVQPLLRNIVKVNPQIVQNRPAAMLVQKLKTMPSNERGDAIHEYARQQVIKILGLDPSQPFDSQRILTDLGMDSLMAVELKNKIEGDLGLNIPINYFLEGATVLDLSNKLHHQFSNDVENGSKESLDEPVDPDTAKSLLANMDQLSEDEVDSLLNNLLTNEGDS